MNKNSLKSLIGKTYNNEEEYREKFDVALKEIDDNLYLNYWDWDFDRVYKKKQDKDDVHIASIELSYEYKEHENRPLEDDDIISVTVEDIFWYTGGNNMKLRVWHNPQIGTGANFYVPVASPEEGYKVMKLLGCYDMFQLNNNIKPNYCNASGLEYYDEEEGEWLDWYNELGQDIDDYARDNNLSCDYWKININHDNLNEDIELYRK